MTLLFAPSIGDDHVRMWLAGALAFSVLVSSDTVLDEHYGVPSPSVALALLAITVVAGQALRRSGAPLLGRRPELHHFSLMIAVLVAGSLPGVLLDIDTDLYVAVQDARSRNIVIATAFVVLIREVRAVRAVLIAAAAALAVLAITSGLHRLGGGSGTAFKGLAAEIESEIANGEQGNRSAGPFADGNFFAQHLIVVAAMAIGSASLVRHRLYRLAVVATVVAAAPVFFTTFSRGGLAALVVALLVARAHRIGWTKLAAIGAAVGVAVLIVGAPALFDRVAKVQDLSSIQAIEQSDDASIRGRASEIIVGVQVFADHPMFGVGYGNYETHYLDYSERLGLDLRRADRGAHSFPIEVLAEQGMIGALAWLGVGAYLWGAVRRRLRDLPDIALTWRAAAAGYATTALVLHDAHPRLIWLLLGTGFAIAHLPGARSVAHPLPRGPVNIATARTFS